jgi:DNA modification methylase
LLRHFPTLLNWGLRDYGVKGQIGLEKTPEEYVENLVAIFREVKRVLRDDGTLWLNLGDSYNGSGGAGGDYSKGGLKEGQPKYPGRKVATLKPKDLVGIPWRVAFALQADGWYLRQDIIWHKPNCMPESVKDRCTKAHEYIFLLSKNRKYYYDNEAIREPYQSKKEKPRNKAAEGYNNSYVGGRWSEGVRDYYSAGKRNKRSVWTVTTKPFKEAHFATFPPDLIKPCILAGCPKNGIVLDPFMGSGTTGMVAAMYQRNFIGFELNQEYCKMAEKRIEPYLMQQTIDNFYCANGKQLNKESEDD